MAEPAPSTPRPPWPSPGSAIAQIAFARSGSTGAGIYLTSRYSTGAWSTPVRRTDRSGDTAPNLLLDSAGKAHVVFRRTAVTAGAYYTTNRTGTFSTATRLPGTTGADSAPAATLGGSAIHAAYSRSGTGPGVFTSRRTLAGPWGSPTRRSGSVTDRTATLAADGNGYADLVFDRG